MVPSVQRVYHERKRSMKPRISGEMAIELTPDQAPTYTLITDRHGFSIETRHHAFQDGRAGEDYVDAARDETGKSAAFRMRELAEQLQRASDLIAREAITVNEVRSVGRELQRHRAY